MQLMNCLAVAIQDQWHSECFLATPVKEPVMASASVLLPKTLSTCYRLAGSLSIPPIHCLRQYSHGNAV